MNKHIKYILIAIFALVLVLVVGIGIFIATFNPNSYKAQVQNLAQKHLNRELSINGDIGLKVFPNIALVVNDIQLMEADNTDKFISINQANVGVALMPLLSKKVVVDSVGINGLVANVVVDKNGKFNFDDLLNAASDSDKADNQMQTSDATSPKGDTSQQLQVDIAGINLDDSLINFTNQQNNAVYTISKLKVSTGQIQLGKPVQLDLKGHIVANQPVLDTDFDLKTTLNADLDNAIYSAQGLMLNLNGGLTDVTFKPAKLGANVMFNQGNDTLTVSNLNLEVQGNLKGATKVNDLTLSASLTQLLLDLKADLNTDDVITLVFGGKGLKIDNLIGDFAASTVLVDNLNLQNPKLNFKLSDGQLVVDNIHTNLYGGKLTGDYKLNAKKAMSVNANVVGVDVGALTREYLQEERLSGKGNAVVSLSMHGFEAKQIMSSLSGTIQTNIDDGAWQGVDLEQTIEEVRASIQNIRNRQIPKISKTNNPDSFTKFDKLQAQAKLDKGVANIDSLSVATKKLEITQGKPAIVNLPASKVDLVVNLQKRLADGSLPESEDKVNLKNLEGVIIPVHIQGNFDALSYKVETSDLIATILKGAIQGDLIDSIKDVLGGKLSGSDQGSNKEAETGSKKSSKESVKDIGKSLKGLFK